MKITDLETLIYNHSIDEAMKTNMKEVPSWYRVWHNAQMGWERGATDRYEVIVRLRTDEGITGLA